MHSVLTRLRGDLLMQARRFELAEALLRGLSAAEPAGAAWRAAERVRALQGLARLYRTMGVLERAEAVEAELSSVGGR